MNQTYGTPYYIAPEILAGEYNEKCDIWSLGVLLFILLSGKPPFDGTTDDEILENVQKGVYKITGSQWKLISKEGIELVKQMLKYDPETRISAKDALNHPWVKMQSELASKNENISQQTLEALTNLKDFRAE